MKLIIGLGNPGRAYTDTRHNIGASVVKALAKNHNSVFKKDSNGFSLSAKAKFRDKEAILALPSVYMNVSGIAVSSLIKKHRIKLDDVLVICDDLDLELGRQKIRLKGSSGGHHGLESIIAALKSQEFSRLRIGIDKPAAEKADISGYVLSGFTGSERVQVEEIIKRACMCSEMWVSEGATKAMNMFNKKNSTMKGRKET